MANQVSEKLWKYRFGGLLILSGLSVQGLAAEICFGAPGDLHDATYSAAQTTCTSDTTIEAGPNVVVVSDAWLSLFAASHVALTGPFTIEDQARLRIAPHYSVLTTMNDTGIIACADEDNNGLACPVVAFPGQDAESGRDVTHGDHTDGHAGFSFTKLSMAGGLLSANATNWSCVRDNVTGLIWEVKTDVAGIHFKGNTYRWGGETAQGSGYGAYYPDWNSLVNGSNGEQLCGFADWRVPTVVELQSLVSYNRLAPDPVIDTDYFPNTINTHFWSALPSAAASTNASNVDFGMGFVGDLPRNLTVFVRLVRSGK